MGAYYLPQGANSSPDHPETLDLACYPAPGNPNDDDDDQQQQDRPNGCCRGWSACLQQLRSNSSVTSNFTTASSSRQGFSPAPSLAATASGASSRQPLGNRLSQLSALFRRQASSAEGSAAAQSQPSASFQQQPQWRPGTVSHTTASSSTSNAAAAAAAGAAEPGSPPSVFERVRSFRRLLSNSYAAEGPVASGGGSSSRRHRDWNNVRLFQVLPPSLTGRAHVWHNQLNIKDGWRPYDMPYFDAVRCFLVTCDA
jgi:hypothetical protein